MANNQGTGRVDDIIASSAYKQIDELIKKLMEVNDVIDKLNSKSKSAEFGLKGASSLTSMSQSLKDAQSALNGLEAARKTFTDGFNQMNKTMSDLATKIGANSDLFQQTAQTVSNATQAVRDNNAANVQAAQVTLQVQANTAKYTQSTADLASKLALQRLEMQEVNKNIKILSDAIRSNSGDVDANSAKLGTWTERQAQLKLEIADTTSQIRSEIKEVVALSGSMDAMSQELFQMKEQYRALSKEERDNANIGGLLLGNIQKMDAEMKKLDATIGNHQRNVGNYNSATMAMSQLLREAPAFANSFQTGLMGISNNIPILIDEINRLKITNQELVASGKQAVPIWQTLGKSFLSFSNILTLALTAYMLYMQKFKGGVDEAEEASRSLSKSLKEIDSSAAAGAAKTATQLQVLSNVVKDTTKSEFDRIAAIREMQKLAPIQLGNLKDEAFLYGDITKEIESATKALYQKAAAEAAMDKFRETYKQDYELLLKERIAREELAKANMKWGKQAKEEEAKFRKGEEADLGFARDIGNAERKLNDIVSKRAELKRTLEGFAKDAEAAWRTMEAPKEKKVPIGAQSFTTGGADALTQAQFEAAKARLQIQMDTNKAIYQDDKYSIELRKQALNDYYNYELQLQQLEIQKENRLNDNIIAEQTRKINEKKNLTKAEQDNALKLIEAAELRNKTLADQFAATRIVSAKKREKDLLDIEKDGVNQHLQVIKTEAVESQLLITEAYANDIQRLQKQLANKEITQAEYTERAKQLELAHRRQLLEIDIAADNEELQQIGITADRKLQLLADIENKKKQLAGLNGSGSTGQKKNDPFEGDFIGAGYNSLFKRIAPGAAEDEQVKAAKKASQLTIQIANETANAILAIEENKFKKIQEDLQKESEAVENKRKREVDAVQATAAYSVEKAQKIQEINARAEAKQSEIDAKKRSENIKAARFEKVANVARILTSTAAAEAQALSYLSNPVTAPLYPVIAGLIAALGGAQLAAALSAPVPAYRYGTKGHKGGPFIAGEAGENELIQTPDGRAYWSGTKATLFNEAAGTKVTPESQLKAMAQRGLMTGGMLVLPTNKDISKEVVEAYMKGSNNIVKAVHNAKPPQVIIINNDSERRYRSKG